jgi:hypothetical protein
LIVTWTDYPGYGDHIDRSVEIPIYAWVTAAPELQNFCKASTLGHHALILRLEQLLGLPPNSGRKRFVELWVNHEDLFRPSPDPEITDHEAELEFPASSRFIKVADEHIRWFNDWKSKAYTGQGYPWTRLGYTYDWGNPDSEVGLSEFVIRKGAIVVIQSVSDLNKYCR